MVACAVVMVPTYHLISNLGLSMLRPLIVLSQPQMNVGIHLMGLTPSNLCQTDLSTARGIHR